MRLARASRSASVSSRLRSDRDVYTVGARIVNFLGQRFHVHTIVRMAVTLSLDYGQNSSEHGGRSPYPLNALTLLQRWLTFYSEERKRGEKKRALLSPSGARAAHNIPSSRSSPTVKVPVTLLCARVRGFLNTLDGRMLARKFR